ncbi:MAG: histidine kinase N-terminal 7TM domain-containing protein, partial [Bacillota bacterium]
MYFFSHLLFFCSIIYLVMGSAMLSIDRKAALNRVFFALNICLFIWSFSAAVSNISADKASGMLWSTIASIGYSTFASVALHFFFVYAKKDNLLKRWWTYIVFYLPTAIFLFLAIKHDLYVSDLIYSQYGWRSIANAESVWFWIFINFIALS